MNRIAEEIVATCKEIEQSLNLRLSNTFTLPVNHIDKWEEAIETAQNLYEIGKRFEMAAASLVANIKYEETTVWDAAYSRAVASSQAAKKEAAESDPEWRDYEARKLEADNLKRAAERWHSVAFQRLETLRELWKKR